MTALTDRNDPLVVVTNAAFAPAVLIAAQRGLWLPCALYLALMLASVVYHLSASHWLYLTDKTCAWAVIGWNFWACLHALTHGGALAWAAQGVLLVMAALWCYLQSEFRSYKLWHSLWHVFSGAAGACFVLAY